MAAAWDDFPDAEGGGGVAVADDPYAAFHDVAPDPFADFPDHAPDEQPSLLHRIGTHLFYGDDENKRQQPGESDDGYRARLIGDASAVVPGLRPTGADTVVRGIDALTESVTGEKNVLGGIQDQATREPGPQDQIIPAIPKQQGVAAQIGAGAVNAGTGLLNFMLSPEGIGTTQALGVLPKAAQLLAGAGFTAQQVKEFIDAPDLQSRITSGIGSVLLGLGTGHEAITAIKEARAAKAAPPNSENSVNSVQTSPPVTDPPPPASFLNDPGIPFMTKVRMKDTALELGIPEEQLNVFTSSDMADLQAAHDAVNRPQPTDSTTKGTEDTKSSQTEISAAAGSGSATTQAESLSASPLNDPQIPELGASATGREIPTRADIGAAELPVILSEVEGSPAAPAPAAEPQTFKSFADIPDVVAPAPQQPRPLTPEEIARRDYEAELLAEAHASQNAGSHGLLDAVAEAGGLPTAASEYHAPFAGELKRLNEFVRDPQRTEKLSPNKLFRAAAPDVDELATRLRERGFDFQTPGDLLDAVEQRVRTGREHYGNVEVGEEQAALASTHQMPLIIESPAEGTAPGRASSRLTIKPAASGGKFGYTVTGTDARGRAIDVFAESRPAAEQIREKIRAGQAVSLKDFEAPTSEQPSLLAPAGTMPRLINPKASLPAMSAATPAAPRSLADIRKYLSIALDIPIRMGVNVPGGMRAAAGLYRVKPQSIRAKALNDIPTIAHEVGHDLHHIVFTDPTTGNPSNFLWGFDGELKPLGRKTSLPSYTPTQIRMEGVAEFTREWLTDRAAAVAAAPNFAAHFETTLRTSHPEIYGILETARKELRTYIDAPGVAKAQSMIKWDQPRERAPIREQLDRLYTRWFNDLHPIQQSLDKLVTLGLPRDVAERVSTLTVNHSGWRGRADADLRFEQTDVNGNRLGKSLHEIIGGIDDPRDFSTYLALKRAIEKGGQGKTTGFEDALADPATHTWLADKAKMYETRRQDLVRYSENALGGLLGKSGYFTPERLDAMRDANRDYVPFYRIYEGVTGESAGPGGGGAGFVNTSSTVGRFKGSDLQIADPLESIIKNTYTFRDLAERNGVAREFVDAVEKTTGGGRVAESVLKPMKPSTISHEEMVAKLKSVGLGAEADKLSKAGVDLAHTVFRAANGVNAKEGTFSVWKDGKERLFQLDDPELLRALTLSDRGELRHIAAFLKPLAWVKNKLRTGATLTLEFMVRNAGRDAITAGITSRNGFVPLYDTARGIFDAAGKTHWYQEWMKSGGSYSGLYEASNTPKSLKEVLHAVVKEPSARQIALDLANPLNAIRNLQRASEVVESATRVSEFRRAIQRGKSPLEAANDSKDVTLNFARGGVDARKVNLLKAFFNAALQDTDKVIRAHREAPMRTMMKAGLYVTAPSVLTWYLGKDDPQIQNLPNWRRDYFWNVNINGAVLSFPKPFLFGAIYGTSAERALDYITGRDPNALRKLAGNLFAAALPGGKYIAGAGVAGSAVMSAVDAILPSAAVPLIENITNYSFFTDRQLVKESQKQLEPAAQFNPDTSEFGKLIGSRLGVSPIKVDNLVRGYTGGLGRYGTDAIDWFLMFLMKTGLTTARAPAPAKTWRDLPGVRAFYGSPYAANEYLGRFYNAMDVAEQRLRTFDSYGNRLETAEQKRYAEKNRNEIVWYKAKSGEREVIGHLRGVQSDISEIGKAMVIIQNSKTITPEQKRDRLIRLKDARDKLAEAAFKTYVHPTDRWKVF